MMKFRIFFFLSLYSNTDVTALGASTSLDDAATWTTKEGEEQHARFDLVVQFDTWIVQHNKEYRYIDEDENNQEERKSNHNNNNNNNTNEEYWYRYGIYAANANSVSKHNAAYTKGYTSYTMSVEENPFSDLTDEEFQQQYLMEPQHCSATTNTAESSFLSVAEMFAASSPSDEKDDGDNDQSKSHNIEYPKSVDWRTKGVITPIKNQKSCGSCWTFSTTGALEAHHCIAHPDFDCTEWTGLAEQQLVDCAGAYNNDGCNGGLPSQAFEYIHYNGGINTEESYPYLGEDEKCKTKSNDSQNNKNIGAQVAQVYNITSHNESEIVAALALVGPVSVAYMVAPDFRFYKHGVYDSYNATTNTTNCYNDPQHVNHAVVAIGYGQTTSAATGTTSEEENASESTPFYIIRNSWGNTWGMEGYFWMERNKNLCGVSDCASFPIVPKKTNKATFLRTTALSQK